MTNLWTRVLLACTTLAFALGMSAQSNGPWTMNVRNADLGEFIEQVQEITGKTIVLDPNIRKLPITVMSEAELDRESVYRVFLAALRTHGLTVVESEGIARVVPLSSVKNQPTTAEYLADPEQIITQVLQLRNIPASEAFKVFRNLMPDYAYIHFVEHSNVLVLSNHKDKLLEMAQIVADIDVPVTPTFQIIHLKHAWVNDVLDLLEQMDLSKRSESIPGAGELQVVGNPRNNSLVIIGHATQIKDIEQVVDALDTERTSDNVTKVIKLRNADAQETLQTVNAIFGAGDDASAGRDTKSKITTTGYASLNALVLRGLPDRLREVEALIDQLDVSRGQVLIEAAVIEVSIDDDSSVGGEIAGGNKRDQSLPILNSTLSGLLSSILGNLGDSDDLSVTELAGAVTTPTIAVAKVDSDGVTFGAIVQAIATHQRANLLMSPYVTVQNNVKARLHAGQTVPFRTGTQVDASASGQFFPVGQQIQRGDVGVTLEVTPNIHDDVSVRMEVTQSVSNVIVPDLGIGDSGFSDIVTSNREITTSVVAENSQTIVLGGLLQDDVKQTVTRMPVFSRIPLIGNWFKRTDDGANKLLLLVFLRPTILVSSEHVSDLAQRKFTHFRKIVIDVGESESISPDLDDLYEGRP